MKGIYCLNLRTIKEIKPKIGALGRITFEKGDYCYVGSAQNGIKQRIARHLRDNKKKHWHIDYLLSDPDVYFKEIFYKETDKKEEECETAQELMNSHNFIPGFGCSDCRCKSHLIIGKIKKPRGFRHLK